MHTVSDCSVTKRKGVLIHVTAQINLQRITLSEKNQTPKAYILHNSDDTKFLKCYIIEMEKQMRGFQGLRRKWGKKEVNVVIKGTMSNPCGDGNVLS